MALADLDGSTVAIPANHKHESWVRFIDTFSRSNGISLCVHERYRDSLEDFFQARVGPDDIAINSIPSTRAPTRRAPCSTAARG